MTIRELKRVMFFEQNVEMICYIKGSFKIFKGFAENIPDEYLNLFITVLLPLGDSGTTLFIGCGDVV